MPIVGHSSKLAAMLVGGNSNSRHHREVTTLGNSPPKPLNSKVANSNGVLLHSRVTIGANSNLPNRQRLQHRRISQCKVANTQLSEAL